MPGIVKTLTKRYSDIAAVEDLSLDVKPGELVSVRSGSASAASRFRRLLCNRSGAGRG
jgi:ABC-type phosphonate transport system ATPase subunit